jgi:hypothetical protein
MIYSKEALKDLALRCILHPESIDREELYNDYYIGKIKALKTFT